MSRVVFRALKPGTKFHKPIVGNTLGPIHTKITDAWAKDEKGEWQPYLEWETVEKVKA